jgi:hypothetical protein
MIRRFNVMTSRWIEWRNSIRKWPWLDCVMAYILVGWSAIAIWNWRLIVTTSRFYSFWFVIHYAAVIVGFAGLMQAVSGVMYAVSNAPRWQWGRRIAAFLGFWWFMTFAANIYSPLGVLVWSALSFVEFLLLAAVLG